MRRVPPAGSGSSDSSSHPPFGVEPLTRTPGRPRRSLLGSSPRHLVLRSVLCCRAAGVRDPTTGPLWRLVAQRPVELEVFRGHGRRLQRELDGESAWVTETGEHGGPRHRRGIRHPGEERGLPAARDRPPSGAAEVRMPIEGHFSYRARRFPSRATTLRAFRTTRSRNCPLWRPSRSRVRRRVAAARCCCSVPGPVARPRARPEAPQPALITRPPSTGRHTALT
ncbi:hypothetical protein SAMN05421630_110260 [Prauserella marina]|uniref:Uncharacterized protein n=1 Tax=Prauserella marina TaxID=530584 RepID=A0A1G6WA09_9PSEU|nr:hypothetical protein DES30_108259 [Prauserella marina]SDD62661.1 hypothetical protein SAMN05421630_110260 [Prauserella marina]